MPTELKTLVEQINLAFEKGDLEFLKEHMTDNVQWNITGREKPVMGKEEFISVCSAAPLKEGTPKIIIKNIILDGNQVAVESIIEAVTLTGRPYRQTVCDIYQFEGDKFNRLTTYFDTAYDKELLDGDTIHPTS